MVRNWGLHPLVFGCSLSHRRGEMGMREDGRMPQWYGIDSLDSDWSGEEVSPMIKRQKLNVSTF